MDNYDLLSNFGIPKELYSQVTHFQVDSKEIGPNGFFFALKGNRVRGEQFLGDIAQKGAIGAFVHNDYKGPSYGLFLVKVEDTLKILQQVAFYKLQKYKAKTIAITGSVGKTTTKEFTAEILKTKYPICKTHANLNSQIGFPLSILQWDNALAKYLVVEMGMSEKGNIEDLCAIAPPDISLITSIGFAHVQNFANLEEVLASKLEIFRHDPKQIKIVDFSLLKFHSINGYTNLITFSITDPTADFYLDMGTMSIYEKGKVYTKISPPFKAKHFLHDLLAAITIARHCHLSYEEIGKAIDNLSTPTMRFEEKIINDITFIHDAYNSNPSSLQAALENLSTFGRGRKVGVLGPMKELGKYSRQLHCDMGHIALKYLDILYCIGEECQIFLKIFSSSKKKAFWFATIKELAFFMKKNLQPKDIVLVKASRSVGLEKIFELFP